MNKNTEIVRSIQIDDKTIEMHIHLSEDEIRHLLLPLVIQAFGDEVRRHTTIPRVTSSNATSDPFALDRKLLGEK